MDERRLTLLSNRRHPLPEVVNFLDDFAAILEAEHGEVVVCGFENRALMERARDIVVIDELTILSIKEVAHLTLHLIKRRRCINPLQNMLDESLPRQTNHVKRPSEIQIHEILNQVPEAVDESARALLIIQRVHQRADEKEILVVAALIRRCDMRIFPIPRECEREMEDGIVEGPACTINNMVKALNALREIGVLDGALW